MVTNKTCSNYHIPDQPLPIGAVGFFFWGGGGGGGGGAMCVCMSQPLTALLAQVCIQDFNVGMFIEI